MLLRLAQVYAVPVIQKSSIVPNSKCTENFKRVPKQPAATTASLSSHSLHFKVHLVVLKHARIVVVFRVTDKVPVR